jgi:hypothetical protein
MGLLTAIGGIIAGSILGGSGKSGRQTEYKETDLGKPSISSRFFVGKGLRQPKSVNTRSARVFKPTFYSFDNKIAAAFNDLEDQDTIKQSNYSKKLFRALS